MTDTIYLTFNGKPMIVQTGQTLRQVCRGLQTFTIEAEKCMGCTMCARGCPSHSISGEAKEAHVIQQETCIHCGTCLDSCLFDAVIAQ
ncbi:MAG: 4Fe-4S dicluster domain-containing protein [Armatimonadota bacterium]